MASAAAASLPGYQCLGPLSAFPTRGLQAHTITSSNVTVCVVIGDRDAVPPQIHAIDNLCPHKQGDMSTGDIEDAGGAHGLCVKCPRHRKKMNGGLNVRVREN